jgi:hypothetical protein
MNNWWNIAILSSDVRFHDTYGPRFKFFIVRTTLYKYGFRNEWLSEFASKWGQKSKI